MKNQNGEQITGENYKTLGCEDFLRMCASDARELSEIIKERERWLLDNYGQAISEFDGLRFYAGALDGMLNRSQVAEKKQLPKTNVYLMVDEHTNFTKIGIAKNPKAREDTLQGKMPLLKMVWHTVGTRDDEATLHDIFKDKRVRGEWFNLSDDDITYIKSLNWRK